MDTHAVVRITGAIPYHGVEAERSLAPSLEAFLAAGPPLSRSRWARLPWGRRGRSTRPVRRPCGSSACAPSCLVIDAVRPVVTSVVVPASAAYVAGQVLDFTVNWSEAVVVDTSHGVPSMAVVIGTGGPMSATYLAGSGTSALTFRTTGQAGQEDTVGIVVGALVLANGRISDAAGNDASVACRTSQPPPACASTRARPA